MKAWINRLNEAMRYIEAHLTDRIELSELSRIACCSEYHFQRMFSYMADVPLSEYIRRRRMSMAAVDVKSGDERIVDIALRYGYDSPTAFNRAFQGVHGAAPSAVRRQNLPVKSYPPIAFHLSVTGGQAMEYRIEEAAAFRVVGYCAPLSSVLEENFQTVPGLWARVEREGGIARLMAMMDGQPAGLLGVSACVGEGRWRYFIGVASSAPAGPGMEALDVRAQTWAVFSGRGTSADIQQLEKRAALEWLPASGYEYADAPDVEVYLGADPRDMRFEVWVPVVRKE